MTTDQHRAGPSVEPPTDADPADLGRATAAPRGQPEAEEASAGADPRAGLALLARVSTVFGMMMAVAHDLPDAREPAPVHAAQNSVVYDVNGKQFGTLTGNQNRILVGSNEIAQEMKQAVIAIEDRRFYEHSGIDFRGIGRAVVQTSSTRARGAGRLDDHPAVRQERAAGTGKRTVFQKLREAALAYHLTRKWTKEKILTEYLNSIYFGNGAYGIESAARTYFGDQPPGLRRRRPADLRLPAARPTRRRCSRASSPRRPRSIRRPPEAASTRRNIVLQNMREQGYISEPTTTSRSPGRCRRADDPAPRGGFTAPYFTSWVRQQLVDRFGAAQAFEGGLQDQDHARPRYPGGRPSRPSTATCPASSPTAAVVVIDNKTGEVRAMVGGRDFEQAPFNLATQGQRQPGSAFKPFMLADGAEARDLPDSIWESRRSLHRPEHADGNEKFVVNNYEGSYAGQTTLADATTHSDNSVYAEVGIKVGHHEVAKIAAARWGSARPSRRTSR